MVKFMYMKKNIIISLIIFIGIIVFAIFTPEDDLPNNDNELLPQNFPDYLKLENGELFCEYGDINNPDPSRGVVYSKIKVDTVEFPGSLRIVDYEYAKDKNNTYYYESRCTDSLPGYCSCYFNKE